MFVLDAFSCEWWHSTPLATDNMHGPWIVEWARKRGFFGHRKDVQASHLLLDGGVLSVPPPAAEEFIAQYAKGVVRRRVERLPCVVERRTPVFRMFFDLDAHMDEALAAALLAGEWPPGVHTVLRTIIGAVLGTYERSSAVVVCIADSPKPKGDLVKLGIHLTFDDVFVNAATARAVRDLVLERLADVPNPFANEYDAIVDEAVFKGSGMRLPWSAKKGDARVYVPVAEFAAVDATAGSGGQQPCGQLCGAFRTLDPDAIGASVAAAREILRRVSLRSFRAPTSSPIALPEDPQDTRAASLTHASLREYADVLPAIEAAIPDQYSDGRITAVIVGEHSLIFRHSSKWCANVGRKHVTSNTYFLLTKLGLAQCCYSRKADGPDRAWCSCEDFKGEVLPLPQELIDRLLPSPKPTLPAMPSRARLDIDTLVARSRPLPTPKKRRTTKKS